MSNLRSVAKYFQEKYADLEIEEYLNDFLDLVQEADLSKLIDLKEQLEQEYRSYLIQDKTPPRILTKKLNLIYFALQKI